MAASSTEYTCHMPHPGTPMVDPATGAPSIAWWNWALKIFSRTGAQQGASTTGAQGSADAASAAAAAAQASADTANASVASEATARAAGDATNAAAITAETAARTAADALALLADGTRAMTGPLVLPVFTVGTLPAASTGATALVTDALGPVWGAAVVGGGASVVTVFWNGAAWVVG
jgi:hypothetical protein